MTEIGCGMGDANAKHPGESVFVFAGQGALHAAIFKTGSLGQYFREVHDSLGGADTIEQFVLAASVAHYRALCDAGTRPATLLGHSFGELSALVCAGGFTLDQGAEIAARRTAVLDEYCRDSGGMLTLETTKATAEHLVQLAGAFRVAIAAENARTDIVISGTTRGLATVRRLARTRLIRISPLNARWALHCGDLMRPAAMELAAQLRTVRPRPLEVPVFSPTLGRYYEPSDDLTECVARSLTLRVRFAPAVHSLAVAGLTRFVDCGALRGLARNIEEIIATVRSDDRADTRRSRAPSAARRSPPKVASTSTEPAREVALAG